MPEAKFHKIISQVVVLHDAKVLLLKRSVSDDFLPGEWEFPGGKLDEGENFEAAAIREVAEETGIIIDKLNPVGSHIFTTENGPSINMVFSAETDTDKVVLSSDHSDFIWVNANNWQELDLNQTYNSFLTNWFKSKLNDVNILTKASTLIIFCDGGSRGNPGPSATGFVIYDDQKNELDRGGTYLGITTNNQAEYNAVKQAAEAALTFQPQKIVFYLDSLLVVNQMKGVFKIRNKDLWPVHQAIHNLLHGIHVEYRHVPREENSVADGIVNEVLDQHKNQV